MTEAQLLKKIKKDPNAFEILFKRYFQNIFNYCYRRTSLFETAKDMASETFLKAYLNIHKFRWKGVSIRTWLYRIATNEINLYYRQKKYRPERMSELYDYGVSNNTFDLEAEKEVAENEFQKHQQFLKVKQALSQLPQKYDEVLSLKYFEQLTIKEIAQVLAKKEGTVKSLLSRGLQKLKSEL